MFGVLVLTPIKDITVNITNIDNNVRQTKFGVKKLQVLFSFAISNLLKNLFKSLIFIIIKFLIIINFIFFNKPKA
jgi:hypothetical protein